jgi:hypothetical protein
MVDAEGLEGMWRDENDAVELYESSLENSFLLGIDRELSMVLYLLFLVQKWKPGLLLLLKLT